MKKVKNPPRRGLISPSFSRLPPEIDMRQRTSDCPCDHMGESRMRSGGAGAVLENGYRYLLRRKKEVISAPAP